MRKLMFAVLALLCFSVQLLAQNRTITGRVTDERGNPIPSVSVTVKGNRNGTTTDNDGKFTLNVSGNPKLTVSSVGFQAREINANEASTISLRSEDQSMNEVVVVAYGTAKKGATTSSNVQVNFDKFKNRPLNNITGALEGAGTGVLALSANGQPGSSTAVRIRGFGSINAGNDPLYVVDGAVYDGGLSNINMDDVESISVLKDAASTALYGARGANGVIIITTKKGRKNRNQIGFKTTQGFTSRALPEYDRVDAYQYYPLMWSALRNSLYYTTGQTYANASLNATAGIKAQLGYNPFNVANNAIVDTSGKLNPNAALLWGDDLDWNKDLVRQGRREEYLMTYSGGADKSDFYASLGYTSEKGYVIRSDQRKITGRLNFNAQPINWFKTGVNLGTTFSNSNIAEDASSTAYVNPFFFTRQMGPIYPLYAHDPTTGAYLTDGSGNRFYDFGNMTALGLPTRASGGSPGRHAIAETKLNRDDYKRNIVSGRAYGTVLFTPDLNLTTNISADQTNYFGSTYDNNIIGDGAPAGRASKTTTITRSYTFNQLLNYSKKIGRHSFAVLAGHENYDLNIDNSTASRTNQVVAGNYDLDNFTTTTNVSSQVDKARIESYLSRANYDFDGKYFVEGSFRRDGNSRFQEDFRWDNFYSAGVAWRLDKEVFMQRFSQINALKLRASYGRVGNDALNTYYPYQALYSLGYNNSAEPGIRLQSLRNDSIRWEGQKSADVALEFGILKNRISGTIEWYNRTSDNLIFGVQTPLSSGGFTVNKNIGEMKNKGWEIQLSGDIIRQKNLNWKMDLNWTTLKNEITKMPTAQPEIISGTKKLAVGHSIYDYWLRDWQGVDPTDGSGLYRATSYVASNSRIRGKEDTVTTSQNNAQFIYAGSAIPDFWGSISQTLSYKGFDLNVLLTYQVGGKIYDANYASLMSVGTYGQALSVDALRAWQHPGDITDVPRMDASKTGVFDAASSRWLIDASYLNIRSVSLSYTIPTALLSRIKASSARFYVSGENLHMFAKRTGLNPQQSYSGVTSNVYSPSRIITFGLNLNF